MSNAQHLFFQPDTAFVEKTAGEVDLPDDPNQWAQVILQELYKQVPYITDYQPHVQMERTDAERGYGLGHVEIQNQTEAPQETPQDQLDAAGVRTVRIPFVVREKKLSPFDLLINDTGAVIPLTENRLRQALFRPQAFDVTSRTPGDQSMIGQLYPPYRQNYGFGGGGMAMNAAGGMGIGKVGHVTALEQFLTPKTAAAAAPCASAVKKPVGVVKHGSILEAILPTLDENDRARLVDEVTKQAQALFARSSIGSSRFQDAVSLVLDGEESVKSAAWEQWLKADVVQVQKVASGYRVKTASHRYWDPQVSVVDRGDVVRAYGAEVALNTDLTGCCTVASGLTKMASEEAVVPPSIVKEPGAYKVMDSNGQEHVGYVVPTLISAGDFELPISLFTNGSVVAIQSEIYGVPAGDISLPFGPIGHSGAFYTMGGSGVRMLSPVELQDSITLEGQPRTYNGTTFEGSPIQISIQDNITDITPVSEGRVLIPTSWKWLALDGAQHITLVNGDAATALHPENKLANVSVISDGMSFSLEGVPLQKIANDQKRFLNLDDAMFLLAGLGVDPHYGTQKLAEAIAYKAPAIIKIARVVERKEDLFEKAMDKAAGVIASVAGLQQPLLLKEAASFPDPQMVDTVLSLGFINPENIMTFVSYLPDLEDAQEKLCELLFGVRLGLSNVPQSAVERGVRSIEEVIEGLKILGFQGS
jgi:hypothetical protein